MSGKRILVVDDEAMVLESVRMTLTHYGFTVETATGGADALTKLAESSYDLVITDRKMPGMPGDQLAAQIKKQWPRLPVILLTGYPPDGMPPGVDAIALKPFSTADLRGTITKLLG
jgi:CheY-like chemotaxis protein